MGERSGMKILFFFCLLMVVAIALSQDQPPSPIHRSGITPPTIVPTLRKWPNSTMMLNLPIHKHADMYQIAGMSTDELLERVRTNRVNLYLIEVSDDPATHLRQALISPVDEEVLSNFHRGFPQHP